MGLLFSETLHTAPTTAEIEQRITILDGQLRLRGFILTTASRHYELVQQKLEPAQPCTKKPEVIDLRWLYRTSQQVTPTAIAASRALIEISMTRNRLTHAKGEPFMLRVYRAGTAFNSYKTIKDLLDAVDEALAGQ